MTFKTITNDPVTLFANAHWCFAARRVDQTDAVSLHQNFSSVRPGDLILARIVKIGQHRGVQLRSGRRAVLSPGDLVVMPWHECFLLVMGIECSDTPRLKYIMPVLTESCVDVLDRDRV